MSKVWEKNHGPISLMNMNVIMWNKVLANGIQQSVKKDDDQVRYISGISGWFNIWNWLR